MSDSEKVGCPACKQWSMDRVKCHIAGVDRMVYKCGNKECGAILRWDSDVR